MPPEELDFDAVTKGFDTKSDKIRALARSGARTADIARYLGIRYQHARNVLMRSGLHRTEGQASVPAVAGSQGTSRNGVSVQIEGDGKILIPADLLVRGGLQPGNHVYVGLTHEGIEILSRRAALERAQAIVAPYLPKGRSLVDEFIADRRREAERG